MLSTRCAMCDKINVVEKLLRKYDLKLPKSTALLLTQDTIKLNCVNKDRSAEIKDGKIKCR